jgi:hypothetical protein
LSAAPIGFEEKGDGLEEDLEGVGPASGVRGGGYLAEDGFPIGSLKVRFQSVSGGEAEGPRLGIGEEEDVPLAALIAAGCFIEPPEGELAEGGSRGEVQERKGDPDLGKGGAKGLIEFEQLQFGALREDAGGVDEELERWGGEGKGLPGEGETELAGRARIGAVVEGRPASGAGHTPSPNTASWEGLERRWG